ncbi:HAD family hydrolase [Candidatus Woesearchaeota archaeon]|nr:HAD family hydrolase [Candidatus Woesearchaeota archaeon]
MPVLYLFDIDGTMVDMMPMHVKAYREAYKKVLGLDIAEKVLVRQFGQVERKIHEAVFKHYGIKNKEKIKPIIDIYTAEITKSSKRGKIKVLSGVKRFLQQLIRQQQPLGIVTGNSKAIGETILKRTGLYGCFVVYSYGNVSKRAHIVRNAIRMARQKGIKFRNVVAIGDAPFDIHAARENRAVAVAVATGRYTLKELKKEKPDFALKSLKSYKELIKKTEEVQQ